MRGVFFLCMAVYVIAAVIEVVSTWYDSNFEPSSSRISKTLRVLGMFIFLGLVVFAFVYIMLKTYNVW